MSIRILSPLQPRAPLKSSMIVICATAIVMALRRYHMVPFGHHMLLFKCCTSLASRPHRFAIGTKRCGISLVRYCSFSDTCIVTAFLFVPHLRGQRVCTLLPFLPRFLQDFIYRCFDLLRFRYSYRFKWVMSNCFQKQYPRSQIITHLRIRKKNATIYSCKNYVFYA